MVEKKIEMMVGPTILPNRVIESMNRQIISHRSEEYSRIHKRVGENLKKVFQTEEEVLILTTSGTGTMESVIQNCFSPRDKVLVPIVGNFSKRYAEIAEQYNLIVEKVEFEYGETADVDEVMKFVDEDTKAILLVHNESSTGVFNDLEAFGKKLKNTDVLLIVDSVSGAGGLEIKMDEWGMDVVLTSSQKALMAPPGLGFVALSKKAWRAVETSTCPVFYFDYKKALEYHKKNQTPWTPSISTLFAVDESLEMILEENGDIYKRHDYNAKLLRKGIKDLGLDLFAKDERYASPTLTAVYVKGRSKEVVSKLKDKGIIVNGGLSPLDEDVFRVGTMGYVSENDVIGFLYALEKVIKGEN